MTIKEPETGVDHINALGRDIYPPFGACSPTFASERNVI